MGVIFPLSTAGRVVLILIAICLGFICAMMWFPKFRAWVIGKFFKGKEIRPPLDLKAPEKKK